MTNGGNKGRERDRESGKETEKKRRRKGARRIVRLAAKIKIPCTLEHFIWRLNCMGRVWGEREHKVGRQREERRERG